MIYTIAFIAFITEAGCLALQSVVSPTQYLDANELAAPSYLVGSTTSSALTQANYGEKILSETSRGQLLQYMQEFDKLSSAMGETLVGRAKFINETHFPNISCCYPDFPESLQLSGPPATNATANLTTIAVQVPVGDENDPLTQS